LSGKAHGGQWEEGKGGLKKVFKEEKDCRKVCIAIVKLLPQSTFNGQPSVVLPGHLNTFLLSFPFMAFPTHFLFSHSPTSKLPAHGQSSTK